MTKLTLPLTSLIGLSFTWLSACAAHIPAAHLHPGDRPSMDDDTAVLTVEPNTNPPPAFELDGQPFCFAGTNNYYLSYKSKDAVLDVLETASKMGLSVIRTWAFIDRGSLDGSTKNIHEPGHHDGVFFQYWDPSEKKPAYNDGENGLERLDFILHHARRLGLKLILPLTNNWRDFGGMDQYLLWYGLNQHHLFYSDERVKQAYRDWTQHLIERVNSIDGVPYRDDPAIMAWELANEPRTRNYESFDSNSGWDSQTIVTWAREMSEHIKSLDPNHLVSVGDEGFFNRPTKNEASPLHWTEQGEDGVDHEALSALPHIDFATFHLYPDHWKQGQTWGVEWIQKHIALAKKLGKPTVLEEYGLEVRRKHGSSGPIIRGKQRRRAAYQNYNEAMLALGGAGALFWILSGIEEGQTLYPDYDHFTVYQGEEAFLQLSDYAAQFPVQAQACRSATKNNNTESQASADLDADLAPGAPAEPEARPALKTSADPEASLGSDAKAAMDANTGLDNKSSSAALSQSSAFVRVATPQP